MLPTHNSVRRINIVCLAVKVIIQSPANKVLFQDQTRKLSFSSLVCNIIYILFNNCIRVLEGVFVESLEHSSLK